MAKKDVKFIRKNGRIIPIKGRKNKDGTPVSRKPRVADHKKKSAATKIGAGFALATGSEFLAGSLFGSKSSKLSSTRGSAILDDLRISKAEKALGMSGKGSMQRAAKNLDVFKRKMRLVTGLSGALKFGGTILGGTLIAKGIDDAISTKASDDAKEVATGVAGQALALGSALAFRKGLKKSFKVNRKGKQLRFKF